MVMLLNVSQLMMEPSGSSREYRLESQLCVLDGTGESLVTGSIRLLRTDKSVWVSALLDTNVFNECGRCLATFNESIEMTIEEEFFPPADPLTGVREIPADDDGDFRYLDENYMLDLAGPVRDYVTLDMPMKPLCKPDCSGLCVKCGANLNETQCQCERAVRDPRWGALLGLSTSTTDKI